MYNSLTCVIKSVQEDMTKNKSINQVVSVTDLFVLKINKAEQLELLEVCNNFIKNVFQFLQDPLFENLTILSCSNEM